MKLRTVGRVTWATFVVCLSMWRERQRSRRWKKANDERLAHS